MKRTTKTVVLIGRTKEFQELFQKSGWKQAEVARRIFVHPNYVSLILGGQRQPGKALLELFRVKVEEEAGGESVSMDSELTHLVGLINRLEPEVRKKVLANFRAFVELFPV